ncbi:MAG TPA: bifunctional hydroxymethylpyrimidine kinase/phosphomethylpyrimidine kinase [Candidatus Baltobacteraceae bacterium]|jgi:hydroxymethylpyrimidine/phosphomethylpyrimidine kinase|nr:bifunctional hydroxymethylpyrimidine kinase/phosphomethylpyrimidine kinase [Candidatus Baltobacteraceae bacterium]
MPVALTVAGSDSGGEAGIQADLKTFAALHVHGASAITCITAQNRKAVRRLEPCSPAMVRAQLEAVAAEFPLAAAKTGMLYSEGIVRQVAAFFRRRPRVPLVVDPVIISTSGRRLLQRAGVKALQRELLPLATLVTPNVAEAEVLTGKKIATLEALRAAARGIRQSFGCAALVKGGHLRGTDAAVDFLCSDDGEWLLSVPRARGLALHGTGCIYSAAITAWLARGRSLGKSVELAKNHITQVLYQAASENRPRPGPH